MNRLCFILFFGLLAAFYNINAQSYYHYQNEKVDLETDRGILNILVTEDFDESYLKNYDFKEISFSKDNSTAKPLKFAELTFNKTPGESDYQAIVNKLMERTGVVAVCPFFIRPNAPSIGTSNIFYVKLNNPEDYGILEEYAKLKKVEIVRQNAFMPDWYRLSTTSETKETALEMSNFFYETGAFAAVDPAFRFNFKYKCANDPDFNSLWGLNGMYSINACDAWGISQGSGIKVAIIDDGVDKTHNDLSPNIYPLSYDANTRTSPSVFNSMYTHGTHVAGIIGAVKDNNLQVVGVAPSSKLMIISHDLWMSSTISEELADGINWAWQNGVDVINNSWGDQGGYHYGRLSSIFLNNAIQNALTYGRNGRGAVVVFISGNSGANGAIIDYPGNSNDNILCVGATTSSGTRAGFSGYGSKLDVVAPGNHILSTLPNNTVGYFNGTSMAAPHASGVAALVLAENPTLTGIQVRDIIEKTAGRVGGYNYTTTAGRPNGDWNNQMGYGLINAYDAVKMAREYNNTLDLYVRDDVYDIGVQPNTTASYMHDSPDIWVRRTPTPSGPHQNPKYNAFSPNYVYVKVTNGSNVPSKGTEQLELNWAKAGISLSWPYPWTGTPTQPPMGGFIGSKPIPVILPGESAIVGFEWFVPNPADYNEINPEPWHFCLLARIVADNDPMVYTGTGDLNKYVKDNNNVAWKNLTIVEGFGGGVVHIDNPLNITKVYDMEFRVEPFEGGKPIFKEAEVVVTMDELLMKAWDRGGMKGAGIEKLGENRFLIKGENAVIENLVVYPNELSTLFLSFNFLTREFTEKSTFRCHIILKDQSGEVAGAEAYEVHKSERKVFYADAGADQAVHSGAGVTLEAKDIGEPAVYNWYLNGSRVHQGITYTTTATTPQTYRLEVIADADGCKDYDDVNIGMKAGSIVSISPNPSSANVLVKYDLVNISSASIMVRDYYGGGMTRNYPLNVSSGEININVSAFTAGMYNIMLLCDGRIVDTKTFIKN